MSSFNLCNEPWIKVKYLSGETKELGIREVLRDADKIADLVTPVFHKDKVYIYDVLVYYLLRTIVMSAYYKEETGYAAKNCSYLEELGSLYDDVIKSYLDKYEDRFDLFSESHPFLQNPNLKKIPQKSNDDSYKTNNILTPAGNAAVFGKYRSIDVTKKTVWEQYDISDKEFAYITLYMAMLGRSSCAAKYKENSIFSKVGIHVILKGKTLKDTIIKNIFPLKESSRPTNGQDKADSPAWEWDSIYEADEYPASEIIHNHLALTFYPGISILGIKTEDNGFIQNILRATGLEKPLIGVSPENTNALVEICHDTNAIWNIGTKGEKGKKEEFFSSYKDFRPDSDMASSLCISATRKIAGKVNCPIVEELGKAGPDTCISLYYRTMDKNKTIVLGIGVVDGGRYDTWNLLTDENIRSIAIRYQTWHKEVMKNIRPLINSVLGTGSPLTRECIGQIEASFEQDFFGQFTEDLKSGKDESVKDAAQRLGDEILSLFDKYSIRSDKIFESVPVRNAIAYELKKRKDKM